MSRQKKRRGTPRPKLAELNRSRVKRLPESDFSRDLVAWIDATITKNELGRPFQLFDFQRAVLRRMFTFDARDRLPYNTIVFSTVKKSGKSFINALVVLWWALTQESPNDILILANDLEQAMGRVFATVCGLIKQNPALRERAKIKQKEIVLDNGTSITVLPSEYAGAAGSNHGLTSWDELWAYDSESAVRLWEELTPVPTRRNSIRFVTTYAGFENESELLRGLYLRGVGPDEAPEGQGTRLEPELPIYANGRLCVFWDHEPRLPWQDADYYQAQRDELRPNAYIRFHENKWTSGESVFLTAAMWDAVTDDRLSPLVVPTKEGAALYVGSDPSS